MGVVGCYTLHLYCDVENPEHAPDEFPHIYTGEFGHVCRAQARRDGWTVSTGNNRGKARCPKCKGKKLPE